MHLFLFCWVGLGSKKLAYRTCILYLLMRGKFLIAFAVWLPRQQISFELNSRVGKENHQAGQNAETLIYMILVG